jgi:diadenosine tetraphosphate (Ap4A) HIT family hydrolase
VIPKHHSAKIHELPGDAAKDIGTELVRVSAAIVKATGCSDYNVLQNNGQMAHQVVPHVHFHIIPKPMELLFLICCRLLRLTMLC